jgi:hypothetical protein
LNINDQFPSKYLKAGELKGKAAKLAIDRVEVEEIADGEDKPVLYFRGAEKGMVLNKTNALTLQEAYGDETDEWSGQGVEVFADKTQYAGKRVDCIRVRAVELAKPKAKAKAAVVEVDDEGDSIPF